MDLLARREHGVKELSRKLINKGFDPGLVDEAIEGLVRDNLVSDRRFCESMVHSRFNRGHGPVKVRYELRSKGVADQIIEGVMDELAPDWQQVLVNLIKKKYETNVERLYIPTGPGYEKSKENYTSLVKNIKIKLPRI